MKITSTLNDAHWKTSIEVLKPFFDEFQCLAISGRDSQNHAGLEDFD